MKYGLQLYTLRELTEKDMAGVLMKVAAMGYDGIELAGFGNLNTDTFAEALIESGLAVISAHVGMSELTDNMDACLTWAGAIGAKRLTIPGIDPHDLEEDTIAETAAKINEIIVKLKFAGITLSYHNHDFEFVNGRLDRLAKHCPDLKLELDTYWVKFAGEDPLKIMKKYSRRLALIHLKDMLSKEELTHDDPNPVLMTGKMNVKAILRQAEIINVPWGIVEMDRTEGDPLEDVEASIRNLRSL
ncbi:MAG: TIM barrel protein [Eubacteriales bacterium]|nr:TIM barrel protein [Eubacteriales bacterium]